MIKKNTLIVGSMTLLSRALGYIRDLMIASCLGTSFFNDIFIAAFRLPNLFRSLLGEGAFSAAFIPIFSSKKNKKDIRNFASSAQSCLLIVLFFLCLIAMFFMPELMSFFLRDHQQIQDPELKRMAINMGMISFPYIAFISIAAFYGGILNVNGKYHVFASAPILLNIALLLFIILGNSPKETSLFLSYGVLVGGIAELIWVLYFAFKSKLLFKISKPLISHDIKKMWKRMIPLMFASGIHHINVIIDTMIASSFAGALSYLYYAERIYQLPLAIIGTTMATVILPVFSRNFAKQNSKKEMYETANNSLDFAMCLILPATFGLSELSQDIINLLFQRGQFDHTSTINTSFVLSILACALPMVVSIKLFNALFFASGDTKTPVKIAFCNLLINVSVSLSLVSEYRHVAIAFASVLGSAFNCMALLTVAIKRSLFLPSKTLVFSILFYVTLSYLMKIFLIALRKFPIFENYNTIFMIFSGAAFYIIALYCFKFLRKL